MSTFTSPEKPETQVQSRESRVARAGAQLHPRPHQAPSRVIAAVALALFAVPGYAWQRPVPAPKPPAAAPAATPADQIDVAPTDDGWPREFDVATTHFEVYQPQLETWQDEVLEARAAVSAREVGAAAPSFGVIWMRAKTQTDKEEGLVALREVSLTRAEFPGAPDKASAYAEQLRSHVPEQARTIALAPLETALAVNRAAAQGNKQTVKNDPPRIIYSDRPAMLVLIDGEPVLRKLDGSALLRVINTRALMLVDESTGVYYTRLLGSWLQARQVGGPWTVAQSPPPAVAAALATLATRNDVDLLEKTEDSKYAADDVTLHVSTVPAELIQTEGRAQLAPIAGTQILYVANTSAQILLNVPDQKYYVLVSGRWFRSESLAGGRWSFVPSDGLPKEFAKIPETHPAGGALVSVAGTPQAEEAVIANSIPQTAAISRADAKIDVQYDGDPRLEPIEGTPLQYAINTPTPVILDAGACYAVENGVWFVGRSPRGPWEVATVVPPVIYTIPPSCPLHYVTYVRVYDSTPEVVYTGYTPGYLGTVVEPAGVVVYGTGYYYPPYIGNLWFGPPCTYGFGAGFACGSLTGFAFGFTAGLIPGAWCHPWWGGYHSWSHGNLDFNRFNFNHVSFNHFNAYHNWNSNVVRHEVRRDAIRAADRVGERRERDNLLAGRDGHVYRSDGDHWQHHDNGEWRPANPGRSDWSQQEARLRAEAQARATARQRADNYQPHRATSGGGFSGGTARPGGFRGGGFQGGSRGGMRR